jgi:uncharacterized protein YqhQ
MIFLPPIVGYCYNLRHGDKKRFNLKLFLDVIFLELRRISLNSWDDPIGPDELLLTVCYVRYIFLYTHCGLYHGQDKPTGRNRGLKGIKVDMTMQTKGKFSLMLKKTRKCLSVLTGLMLQKMIGRFCGLAIVGNRARDASLDNNASEADDRSVGGQAVIEGVMMRSPRRIATAVRKPDREILTKNEPYIALSKRYKLLNIPVLRGAFSFFEMLLIGIKTLNFSADVAFKEAEKAGKGPDWQCSRAGRIKNGFILVGIFVLSFGLALVIFFALPLFLTEVMGLSKNALSFNCVAGLIRVCFFLAYLWVISQWKEIKRILEYHGAEHKSIYAYEAGDELSIENARKYSTHHPRCGTSFLLIVVILAVLLFAIADTIVGITIGHTPTLWQRFITHFSLLPLLGGIAYELLKLSGKKHDNRYIRWLATPGLWLQKMTTQEPDDSQLEVAIVALKGALEEA